jgi:hypothetical protein
MGARLKREGGEHSRRDVDGGGQDEVGVKAPAVAPLRDLWTGLFEHRLIGRAVLAMTVYAAAAIASLATVIIARRDLPPDTLRILLSYLVIATISAGLEPGTTKAAALMNGGQELPPVGAVLIISTVKAILAAAILALIWKLSAPGVTLRVLLLTPLITVAGFCTTDLRVKMDLEDHHTRAIAFKQISTVASAIVATLMMLRGVSAFWAILAASLFRFAMLAPALHESAPWRAVSHSARDLVKDTRWIEFAGASALSATTGSIDRLFALHFLPAAALGGYYVTFEILSRFWLLPYLMVPILFARRVRGEASGGFLRGAWIITAIAATAFMTLLSLIVLIRPPIVAALAGRRMDSASLALAAAVVISSFNQLRIAELQASGRGRRVILVLSASVVWATLIFWVFARYFGAAGLMWGWALRTCLDFLGMRFFATSARMFSAKS